MGLWLLEAAVRAAVTMPLLVAIGDIGFAAAAVIGVFVGWAPFFANPWLAALLPIAGLATIVVGGLVDLSTSAIGIVVGFAGLKAVQAVFVASRPAMFRGFGAVAAALMGGVAFVDGGLVGLGLVGLAAAAGFGFLRRSDSRQTGSFTAGMSRITFRSSVVVAVLLAHSASDIVALAIAASVTFFLVDLVARLSRWLHPSREEQGRSMGGIDHDRFFQRTLEGTLLLGFGGAMLLAFFGDAALARWFERSTLPAHLALAFAPALLSAPLAFVSGQWLVRRGGAADVDRALRFEAIGSIAAALVFGAAFGVAGVALGVFAGQLFTSAISLPRRAIGRLEYAVRGFVVRRIAICTAASLPGLVAGLLWVTHRDLNQPRELAMGAFLVTIAHAATSFSYWMLSSRRGW